MGEPKSFSHDQDPKRASCRCATRLLHREKPSTVDVRLGGQVDQFFWSAGVSNLFDEEYFDYAVASASESAIGTYNAYPLPGRTFILKAGAKW